MILMVQLFLISNFHTILSDLKDIIHTARRVQPCNKNVHLTFDDNLKSIVESLGLSAPVRIDQLHQDLRAVTKMEKNPT